MGKYKPERRTNMKALIRIARNQKDIEHEAFYHGSQGCTPQEALAEIGSKFNQQMEVVSQKATPRIKELEATLADAHGRLPAAQERLGSIVARHRGRLPEIVLPTFMVAIGIFALLAESAMLAPFMDILDITNPFWQHVAALALGCACAILLHLAIESLTTDRFERNLEWLLRVLGIFCGAGLTWAGIARGRQAAYGASLSGSPLAGFIGSNTILSMIVYAFFTVTFPVAGALAITFGIKTAREWKEFLLAKREVGQLNTVIARAPKELEGEQKKLRHELNTLESTRDEWQKAYLVQHERGTTMGAAQFPKWIIWVKAAFVALVALLLSLPMRAIPIVPVVVTVAAYIGAWVYFHKAWAHPKPRQLYSQQNVEFRKPQDRGGAK
jgi:hypothetical protein